MQPGVVDGVGAHAIVSKRLMGRTPSSLVCGGNVTWRSATSEVPEDRGADARAARAVRPGRPLSVDAVLRAGGMRLRHSRPGGHPGSRRGNGGVWPRPAVPDVDNRRGWGWEARLDARRAAPPGGGAADGAGPAWRRNLGAARPCLDSTATGVGQLGRDAKADGIPPFRNLRPRPCIGVGRPCTRPRRCLS
jgi:hypothetical protein